MSSNTGIVRLHTPEGASAEIHVHGAHVTSWVPAGGSERLFLSATSDLSPGAAIRGGVPVVFPQFGGEGALPKHGFARNQVWTLSESSPEAGFARFVLRDSAESHAIWPQAFEAQLDVGISGAQLTLTLTITNTGGSAFTFTGALHTYFRVKAITDVRIAGLQGLRYLDAANGRVERVEEPAEIAFTGEVDRVYFDAPQAVDLREPGQGFRVEQQGFVDTVVWNPSATKAAALPDMEPEGYRRMVCIEAATVRVPVRLEPGQGWIGVQRITAS